MSEASERARELMCAILKDDRAELPDISQRELVAAALAMPGMELLWLMGQIYEVFQLAGDERSLAMAEKMKRAGILKFHLQ